MPLMYPRLMTFVLSICACQAAAGPTGSATPRPAALGQQLDRHVLATPMDAAGGYFTIASSTGRLASNDGHWSAADDLLTTVDAYARFLVGVIHSDNLSGPWITARTQILSSLEGDPIWNCVAGPGVTCATHYGHGLGWMVYQFDHKTVVKHGGNDKGENALAIYSPETGNGAVIFVNGGNGVLVSTQILALINDQPEIAAYYRQLVKKFYNVELPVLTQ